MRCTCGRTFEGGREHVEVGATGDSLGARHGGPEIGYLSPGSFAGVAPPRGGRGRLLLPLLVAADLSGLLGALLLSGLVSFGGGTAYLLTLPAWLAAARLYGLYTGDKRHTNHSTIDEAAKVFHFVTIGAWVAFIVSALFSQTADPGRLIGFWASAIAL